LSILAGLMVGLLLHFIVHSQHFF